jgi:hypothetical protein
MAPPICAINIKSDCQTSVDRVRRLHPNSRIKKSSCERGYPSFGPLMFTFDVAQCNDAQTLRDEESPSSRSSSPLLLLRLISSHHSALGESSRMRRYVWRRRSGMNAGRFAGSSVIFRNSVAFIFRLAEDERNVEVTQPTLWRALLLPLDAPSKCLFRDYSRSRCISRRCR